MMPGASKQVVVDRESGVDADLEWTCHFSNLPGDTPYCARVRAWNEHWASIGNVLGQLHLSLCYACQT